MHILLLGGTRFLGKYIAQIALTRGHDVTCLARGTSAPVAGTRFVKADRDEDDGLEAVSGERWDVVIDLAVHPEHARRAANGLNAAHAIFVSTGSVYAEQTAINSETDELVTGLDQPKMSDMQQYPCAKASCEKEYSAAFDQLTIIRPGLIGGYGDETGRCGYYPWRFANPTGPEVVVPDPSFPVAILDAEDLATWIVICAEERITGEFNAAGEPTTLAEVVEISRQLAANDVQARVVNNDVLLEHEVAPWMGPESLPLWLPDPALRNVALLESELARSHKLTTRPLAETLAAGLRYEQDRQTPRHAGLSDEKEREILAAHTRRAMSG